MMLVTRQTYPKDETVVTVWMNGIGSAIVVLLTGAAKLLTDCTTPAAVLSFLVVIICFFVVFFLEINQSSRRGRAATNSRK